MGPLGTVRGGGGFPWAGGGPRPAAGVDDLTSGADRCYTTRTVDHSAAARPRGAHEPCHSSCRVETGTAQSFLFPAAWRPPDRLRERGTMARGSDYSPEQELFLLRAARLGELYRRHGHRAVATDGRGAL